MKVEPRVRAWLMGARADPSVRHRYLVEVEGRPPGHAGVRAAQRLIGRAGWAARLLEDQHPDGHWVTPGTRSRDLYVPKYIVTNWRAIMLGELGMTRSDPRIRHTAELILKRWGRGREPLAGDPEICITGNAVRTLLRYGYVDHPVVEREIRWIVKSQKSDGGWHCFKSGHGTLDGWEGLAALSYLPEDRRDGPIQRAIDRGAEFYLRRHLMDEGPTRYEPWFRIHYPNHYYYDVLVGLQILARLGRLGDRRAAPALRWLRSKRSGDGTWALDAVHPDFTDARFDRYAPPWLQIFPVMLERTGVPSQWATVSALSVLARAESG
jgi:hypothetical protein